MALKARRRQTRARAWRGKPSVRIREICISVRGVWGGLVRCTLRRRVPAVRPFVRFNSAVNCQELVERPGGTARRPIQCDALPEQKSGVGMLTKAALTLV